jgi:quercetin dioxygenase-like cupin family protein
VAPGRPRRGRFCGVCAVHWRGHLASTAGRGLDGLKGCVVSEPVRLYRWDEIALEKVTEMISRKFITGHREMLAQVYLKRGAVVPMHSHESEQLSYVLQGALKFLVGGESITVREGEVLHIPSWVEHQAEALEDTFELDMFSPIRQDWLDKTDDYFRK